MRLKPSVVLAVLGLVFAACTQGSAPDRTTDPAEGSLPRDILLLGTADGPVAASLPAGSVLVQRPGSVAGADGSLLYSATSEGGSTSLETIEAATGDVVGTTRLRGDLEVRVVSGSGRAVALMAPPPGGTYPRVPLPRSLTEIVVADPAGERDARRYRIEGNFEPEAFSVEDDRLFLIQYLPAEAPAVYRVVAFDIAEGEVVPVSGRFKSPPEQMPGTRLEQDLAPDARQMYTLYSSRPPAYVHDTGFEIPHAGRLVTFIHVLNMERGWAYCVGLPRPFWREPAPTQAMAVSPDGERLYVLDAVRDVVAVMDTRTLKVLATERVQVGSVPDVPVSAQVSSDGGTLFVGSTGEGSAIRAIDTSTWEERARWPMPATVSGLGLSGDGARLYVALGDRIAVLDPASGQELGAVPFAGVEGILDVGTVGS